MNEIGFDRKKVLAYAKRWAFSRNPRYLDFESMGGDCTNFASQCLYAGCNSMNYQPVYGWYYNSGNDRAPAWTGVEYLYRFLIGNHSAGPYAIESNGSDLEIGDIIQFGDFNGHFYHSPVITGIEDGSLYVAAHSFDAYMRPASSYEADRIRYLHIVGARKYE